MIKFHEMVSYDPLLNKWHFDDIVPSHVVQIVAAAAYGMKIDEQTISSIKKIVSSLLTE
ncbi:hypothetical protein WMW72_12195 [Paenibacillus filicis]|uniref:Uncharacterized protein n=1 Tax=Paenibacillus filicis TaxID=669464 RepID=A0ABU9DLM3_9BACL